MIAYSLPYYATIPTFCDTTTLDYQIHQLSTVTAPYEGTIKKVKWTGQSDHNLTAVVTLSVTSQQSAVSSENGGRKSISGTQAQQITKTQP